MLSSHEKDFIMSALVTILCNEFENYTSKLLSHIAGMNELSAKYVILSLKSINDRTYAHLLEYMFWLKQFLTVLLDVDTIITSKLWYMNTFLLYLTIFCLKSRNQFPLYSVLPDAWIPLICTITSSMFAAWHCLTGVIQKAFVFCNFNIFAGNLYFLMVDDKSD